MYNGVTLAGPLLETLQQRPEPEPRQLIARRFGLASAIFMAGREMRRAIRAARISRTNKTSRTIGPARD